MTNKNTKNYVLIVAHVEGEKVRCCIDSNNIHEAITLFKEDIMAHLYVSGFASKHKKDRRDTDDDTK